MAKDAEKPVQTDKGKGKAPESGGPDGSKKAEELKKDKNGKLVGDGKPDTDAQEGRLVFNVSRQLSIRT